MPNKYWRESIRAQEAARKLKMCESKRPYDTKEQAQQKGQNVYRCEYCDKWHRSGSLAKLISFVNKLAKQRRRRKKVKR